MSMIFVAKKDLILFTSNKESCSGSDGCAS